MKSIKRIRTLFCFILMMTLFGCGAYTTDISDANVPTADTVVSDTLDSLSVHFIDVGQGDAVLIQCGDSAMLLDAGGNDMGTRVQNYLTKQGVTQLDYAISTHADEDHCGGLDVILYKFPCDAVMLSPFSKDTASYRDVLDTIEERRYHAFTPAVGDTYALGDAAFTILGPSHAADSANDSSIALLLTHGEKSFLFTGDAEVQEESELLACGISLDCDVYKAGHHGSSTSSSQALLQAASPTYCVISCGDGNAYGHPHAETLNNLRSMGIEVFRTDEQGSVIATSDGKEITWNCAPSTTWQAGERTASSQQEEETVAPAEDSKISSATESSTITYVCNTNTKKFHKPTCSSAKKIKDSNRRDVTVSRDEVMQMGYVPCKNCNP